MGSFKNGKERVNKAERKGAEGVATYKLCNEEITPLSEGNVSDLTKRKNELELSKLN